jgi:hypothetical protein
VEAVEPRLLGTVFAENIAVDSKDYVLGPNGEKYPLIVTNVNAKAPFKPKSWRWSGNNYSPVLK